MSCGTVLDEAHAKAIERSDWLDETHAKEIERSNSLDDQCNDWLFLRASAILYPFADRQETEVFQAVQAVRR